MYRSIRNSLKLYRYFLSRPADVIWFLKSYRQWQSAADPEWQASMEEIHPMLRDRHESAGSARGHYFLQDIWAARHVLDFAGQLAGQPAGQGAQTRESSDFAGQHVDVGSRVDGFVGHVLSSMDVEYVDIRPMECEVPGLAWRGGSICELPHKDQEVSSLSCLHVIEHIGLGRYGDPLDPHSWKTALSELQRILAPGGQLLIGTPCGRSRTVYHAHRIFSPHHIIDALPELDLQEFSYIPDDGAFKWIENAATNATDGAKYACGLFRFTRPTE